VLRDFKRAQQSQRRGDSPSKWRLYETPTGKVPKDLVTMFAGIPTPQIASPPRRFLTDGERGALSEVLGFIDRHGARNNPRFLFVVCHDVAVFLTAFAKKSQKLSRADVARAEDRFRTMKDGCS